MITAIQIKNQFNFVST